MSTDVGKPHVDIGDSVRIPGNLRFFDEVGPLAIGGEHRIHEALRSRRRFLRDRADPRLPWNADRARLGRELAEDETDERCLAYPVAADESDLVARRYRHRRALEEEARSDAVSEAVDMQHGGGDSGNPALCHGRSPPVSAPCSPHPFRVYTA